MILGTFANLGAIDEHQSGVEVDQPIDRLPDIHVTYSNVNMQITPSKIDPLKNKVDTVPNKSIDLINEANAKLKIPKRKTFKSNKTQEQLPRIETAREINLNDDAKPQAKPIENAKPDGQNNISPLKIQSNLNVKSAVESKSNVASLGAEPTKKKNLTDSLINKDAIQKEEREIEFNANEQRRNDVERTQKILDAVKNQLTQQNEENHKIVLQKINEISEKVNRITQKDEHTDTSKMDVTKNAMANKSGAANQHVDNNLHDKQTKMPLPPVPIAKLLVERKVSSVSDQLNEPKLDMQPIANIVVDPKRPDNILKEEKIAESLKESPNRIDETLKNANVGRDLLSHRTAQTNGIEINRDKKEN